MSERIKETLCTKKDFRIDWFSGKGAGGQHRNKHQNCCRMTHIPTGMTATGQSHRERPANQREAFRKIAKRLVAQYRAKAARERFTEVIRTYHEPRNVVKDKASGLEQSYKHVVTNKHLEDMIAARQLSVGQHDT